MPHKTLRPSEVDVDTGDFIYPASPADLKKPGSKALGLAKKAEDPRTSEQDQTPGGSSALKPSQPRPRHRQQQPKRSFCEIDSVDGFAEMNHTDKPHLARKAAALVPAPFNDVPKHNRFSPAKVPAQQDGEKHESFPNALRSGQNVSHLESDDDEDQEPMSGTDESPTPMRNRLTSSHKRNMSDTSTIDERPKKKGYPNFSSGPPSVADSIDEVRKMSGASDEPVPPESGRMESSRQRNFSDPSTIDERPKKKGYPNFSSGPPSVTGLIDEGPVVKPLQKISHNMRGRSAIASQTNSITNIPADRRKSVVKSNTKVQLSALDLEDDEVDVQSDDPFDQANIPPSRGVSPRPSKRATKEAPKRKRIAKPYKNSPSTKKFPPKAKKSAAKSPKSLPQEKRLARLRQKAKPSAAEIPQQKAAPTSDENGENDGYFPDKSDRSVSVDLQAASSEPSAPTRKTGATSGHPPAPQKDVVYISSATESEDSDTDETDSDEYVDASVSKDVQGTKQPPKTRNTRSKPMAQNGNDTTSNLLPAVGKGKEKQTDNGDGMRLSPKPLPIKPNKTGAAQTPVPSTELAGKPQPTKKPAAIEGSSVPVKKTVNTQQHGSNSRSKRSADETENSSSALESAPQQLKQTKPTHQSQTMPRGTKVNQKDKMSASTSANELHGQQARATRGSQANQSQSNPVPSKSKAIQNRNQAKPAESMTNASPKVAQDGSEKRTVRVKNKERKANIVAFGDEGPKKNGKSRKTPNVDGHQSEQQVWGTNPNSSTTNDAKTEHSPTGDDSRIQKKVQSQVESAPPPEMPLAQRSQTQQPFPQVEERGTAVDHAVKASVSSENERAHSSRESQNRTVAMTRKPSTIFEEEEEENTYSPPPRATYGKGSVKTQRVPVANNLKGDKHDSADDTANLSFGDDPIDELGILPIPDSLEQLDVIDNPVSMSQLKHAAMISEMLGQGMTEVDSRRKRPLPGEDACRFVLPVNDQDNSQAPIKNQTPTFSQKPEQQILFERPSRQAVINQQPFVEPNPAKEPSVFSDEPAFHQRRSMNQESAMTTKHHPVESFVQPGLAQDSAKLYLQPSSTDFQRPSKRAKVGLSEPNAESHLPMSNNNFRVRANGYSSDDVFAPKTFHDRSDIDHGVVHQLRGIGSVKPTAAPGRGSHSHMVSPFEKAHELSRQRQSTHVPVKASRSRPIQRSSSSSSPEDESPEETIRSDLRRQSMMNRRVRGTSPNVNHKEQVVVEDPEHYEGVEDVMHRIVAGVLRALHSKESEVHQVVDDYKTRGAIIAQSIAATHVKERDQLIGEHENNRLDYIQICENARRQIGSISLDLQSIDFGTIAKRKNEDKTLDHLRRLDCALSLERSTI